jgi:hypothetical protein
MIGAMKEDKIRKPRVETPGEKQMSRLLEQKSLAFRIVEIA